MLPVPTTQIACNVYRNMAWTSSSLYKLHQKRFSSTSSLRKEQTNRPLVLFLPWLGAAPKASEKYVTMYRKFGFDVLKRQPKPIHILWPLHGLKESRQFLHEIQAELSSENRPIIIHCVSVGGYYYALMLMLLKAEPETFQNIISNIQCQIIDSPVLGTVNEVAIGVAQMASQNQTVQKLIKILMPLYYAATSPYTAKYYNESMDTIKLHPPVVPSLIMSSENDPMILPRSMESHVTAWTGIGIDNNIHMWENSEHAQHLKNYPIEYENMVGCFVKKALSKKQ